MLTWRDMPCLEVEGAWGDGSDILSRGVRNFGGGGFDGR